jgi:DNA-binding protein H-NS
MATAGKKAAGKEEAVEPKAKQAKPAAAAAEEVNLAGFSTEELRQLARDVEQELNRRRVEDRKTALREIRELAASYGFTVEEVLETPLKRRRRDFFDVFRLAAAPAEAKYRNPDNPEQTWAGRGRRPEWLVGLLAQGKTLEELEFVPGQIGEFI